ncbi:alpha/beta fold hydrolase [Epidermidibacterium keratini]|uniref:Alpha/beta fold hydrolase n=1 Tax=Epidermidibacterium keratini TaxID=1891644 RepID=A0A7L4YJF4_9ACTN|nr:alpha/beta hydrolase [Epidermidibacterium keratini]QHB98993.1 alpha/beta fold hydrolase [Epidermidibacterium keratini]
MDRYWLPRSELWRGREIKWGVWGEGPPVVLLHGTPWSSVLWQRTARRLAASYRVYAWDMPGYGQSSKDPRYAVDLGVQSQAFADLLELWRLEQPHVIAHDIGGAVGLRTRLLGERTFASLCLVDVVALRPWGSPFFRLVQQHSEVFEQLPAAIHRGALEAYIRGASHAGLSEEELAALAAPWLEETSGQSAFYRQIAQADERFTAEIEGDLGRIDEPVHIIWGQEDTWIPPDRATRLQDAIPGSTLRLVPDAGHLIQLDAPEVLDAELERWLAEVKQRARRSAR